MACTFPRCECLGVPANCIFQEKNRKSLTQLKGLAASLPGLKVQKEVYPDCEKPQGCVFCGGECPYIPAKSSDVLKSANDFKYRWSITNPQG